MSGALTRSVVHGMTWTVIGQAMGQGLRFVAIIFLARLLLPDDFGVIAMAIIFTGLVSRAVDLGFNQSLIQRKEVTPSHLSTTFWTSLAMGIMFCIVTVALSPVVGKFFDNDSVGPVLAVLSLSFVIIPLGSVHGSLLKRRLDFFRFSIAEIGGSVTYLAVTVVMAFSGFGVWSLVWGSLASDLTYVALRWVLCRWHPSLMFSRNSLKDLWGFGLNVTGTKLIGFLVLRLDYLIIGRVLTPVALGFYSLGCKIVDYPAQYLSLSVERVAFPAFSTIQDEDERLRRGFLKAITFACIVGLPIFGGLALVAPEFVRVVFGDKWTSAVLPMQILCVMMGIVLLCSSISALFLSKGRADIFLKLTLAGLAIKVICLVIGVRFGITGVALGALASTVILWPVQQLLASRLIGLRMRDYLAALRPGVVGSAVMALTLLTFRYGTTKLFNLPDAGLMACLVLLGAVTYFITLKVTRTQALNEMFALVLEMIRPYARSVMLKMAFFRKAAQYGVKAAHERK